MLHIICCICNFGHSKSALDKDEIGNTLFQEVCDTKTGNSADPTETLKSIGKDVETNEVDSLDTYLDAAQSEFFGGVYF